MCCNYATLWVTYMPWPIVCLCRFENRSQIHSHIPNRGGSKASVRVTVELIFSQQIFLHVFRDWMDAGNGCYYRLHGTGDWGTRKSFVCIRVTTSAPRSLFLLFEPLLLRLASPRIIRTRHPTKFELPRELTFVEEQSLGTCSAERFNGPTNAHTPHCLAPRTEQLALFVYLRKSPVRKKVIKARVRKLQAHGDTVGRIGLQSHGLSNSPCPTVMWPTVDKSSLSPYSYSLARRRFKIRYTGRTL